MGKRGPIPKSNVTQLRRGNPGKRRAPKSSPRPVRAAPSCPTWLDREAKAEWKRIVPELERMGILSRLDRAILTAYCCSWGKYVALGRKIDAEGEVVTGYRGSKVVNPTWRPYRTAADMVIQLAKELGLSPAARSRMNTPERPDDDSDLD